MEARQRSGIALALILVGLTISCGNHHDDPYWRVSAYRAGQLEAELRDDVGAPTCERRVDVIVQDGTCNGTSADRELIYEIPSHGIEKRVRDTFKLSPAASFAVCVNRAGYIVRVSTVQVN